MLRSLQLGLTKIAVRRYGQSHHHSLEKITATPVSVRKQLFSTRITRVMSTVPEATLERDEEAISHSAEEPALKPWPKPVVVTNGDYRAEAFLEEHIGGPLYANQTKLPRLPISTIQETLERFLPTALPLAKNQTEIENLQAAVRAFPQQAQELQRRLIERRDVAMGDSSWLQLWWNTAGYLQVRDPVVVNVSYFFHFSDDATLPTYRHFSPGVMRGASILFAAAEFRKMVADGALPCETIGRKEPKTPLCSTPFKYMFHACRVPKREHDVVKLYDPSQHTHAIVARKGQFFSVDFVDKQTGNPLPVTVLEERLDEIVKEADERMDDNDENYDDHENSIALSLGILTSNDRDSWADARDELIRAGGKQMKDHLERLESGALLLCLDDEQPESKRQVGEMLLHGGLSSGHNRWFDKSIQIIVANNGKAGLLGEHSMMDGMPMVSLANHITATTYEQAQERSSDDVTNVSTGMSRIFIGDAAAMGRRGSAVAEHIVKAKQAHAKLVKDHDLQVQSYHGYGSSFIKKAGFSPDAYVQMAMQLAGYRLFGEQVGTYEATQVRPFLHGRTETTRSVSLASEAFVKKMGLSPKFDEHLERERKEKLGLLKHAVHSHVQYIAKAAQAKGVDRHFFGLSMIASEDIGGGDDSMPSIYSDPLFVRSKRWRMSTSHLTHPKFENWGYGEVFPDGVGLAYSINPESCVFNITALQENNYTEALSYRLEEALDEIRALVEMDKEPTSKL